MSTDTQQHDSRERVGVDTEIGCITSAGGEWVTTYYERVFPSGRAVLVMKTVGPKSPFPRYVLWTVAEQLELRRVLEAFNDRRHAAHCSRPKAPRYEPARTPGQPRGRTEAAQREQTHMPGVPRGKAVPT
jgi:hypothetical protein